MAMTLKVYEVDRYGNTRVLLPEAEVTPVKGVPHSHAYPACECEQCTGRQQ